MESNKQVYKNVTIADIYEEIHSNSKNVKKTINKLIKELNEMVGDVDAALIIVPLIVQYLEVAVKNNEHLIKLINAVQKFKENESSIDELNDEIMGLMSSIESDEK